jgi:hypothetical protein
MLFTDYRTVAIYGAGNDAVRWNDGTIQAWSSPRILSVLSHAVIINYHMILLIF